MSRTLALCAVALIALSGCASVTPVGGPSDAAPTPIIIYVTAPPVAAPSAATPTMLVETPRPAATASSTPAPTLVVQTPKLPTPTMVVQTPAPPTPTLNVDLEYQTIDKRSWQEIVRSPDDHTLDTITIWGCISQFDTNTGDDTFRAQASYKKEFYWYLDGDNSLFAAVDASMVSDFFEDDVFKAQVAVIGSYTYDTTIGGSETVPSFLISDIQHAGSC